MANDVCISGDKNMTCNLKDFKCENQTRCIPGNWRCDGQPDCEDASDEKNCDKKIVCDYPSKLCPNTSECMSLDKICDGIRDCPDGSDEGVRCGMYAC